MRIIKEGVVPTKEYLATCSNCSTEFGFYKSDGIMENDRLVTKCPLENCGIVLKILVGNKDVVDMNEFIN